MSSRLHFVLITMLAAASPLSADVRIVERSVVTAGDKVVEGQRATYIKGPRMRIEQSQAGRITSIVYDLAAAEIIELDGPARKAEVREMAARHRQLEKEYPAERTAASVGAANGVQTLAGISCSSHPFNVRVPVTKSGEIVLVMTGTACLAAAGIGVDDYRAFAAAAVERQLVIGQATDNAILLAIARGQTELYRALSRAGGLPLSVDLRTEVEGNGMLAGIVRKAATGTRIVTATSIDGSPLEDRLFAVPEGWKRELKK